MIPSTLTVITNENYQEIPQILETVVKRGIIFDMGLYQHVGGLFSPADAALKLTDKDVLERLVHLLSRTKMTSGYVAPSLRYLASVTTHYENLVGNAAIVRIGIWSSTTTAA